MTFLLRARSELEPMARLIEEAHGRHPAPELGWLRSELLIRLGSAAQDRNDPAAPLPLLDEAMRAARLSGHERVRTRAAIVHALVTAMARDDPAPTLGATP